MHTRAMFLLRLRKVYEILKPKRLGDAWNRYSRDRRAMGKSAENSKVDFNALPVIDAVVAGTSGFLPGSTAAIIYFPTGTHVAISKPAGSNTAVCYKDVHKGSASSGALSPCFPICRLKEH